MTSKWRARLYGYTGLVLVFGLWTPLLWYVSYARREYGLEAFEVFSMDWFGIVLFILLAAGTLVAQFGFILLAQDMSELERREKENGVNYAEF
jgi:hypothetical protein